MLLKGEPPAVAKETDMIVDNRVYTDALVACFYFITQAVSGGQEPRRVLAPGVGAAPAQGRMR